MLPVKVALGTIGRMLGDTSPFALAGGERGALLIHGFTGTPFEVRPIGARLHARGYTVTGMCLPGHGTTPDALERTTWRDWASAVEREFDDLARRCRSVAIVGQSLGGLLGLHLAARRADVAALATLGAPMWLGAEVRLLIAALRRVPALAALGPLPKTKGSDVADRVMWTANPSYKVVPLRALVELDDLRLLVRSELRQVTAPLYVVHALHDHVAPYDSAAFLAAAVGSPVVDRLTLPRSFHIVAMDVERDQVAAAVGDFLDRHLGAPR